MRVLWVVHNLAYPPVRGVLQRNYNLIRQASKFAEVHVLAFDQPATRPPGVSVEDCLTALREFCAYAECVPIDSGISRNRYFLGVRGLFSKNPYDINWLSSDAMVDAIDRVLSSSRFDVVHFDTIGLAQYRGLAKDAGTALNHHNIESTMMAHRASTEPRRLLRQFFKLEATKLKRAEQSFCGQFDMNLVVSPEDGEVLKRHSANVRTTVVANGVDTDYFVPRADPGGKTLLFCGGLDWYPNGEAMEHFFEAIWPRLTRRIPDVQMLVVGRRPPKWLQDLGESDRRVRVTGFVDDVRPYFREAIVYVCPIRIGGGTRLKILDALAMGMPLVGTTFACSGIAVEHERNVLLADDPDSFVDEVVRLLDDSILRSRLASSGRDLVLREYSWDVVGRSLMSAYEAAVLRTASA